MRFGKVVSEFIRKCVGTLCILFTIQFYIVQVFFSHTVDDSHQFGAKPFFFSNNRNTIMYVSLEQSSNNSIVQWNTSRLEIITKRTAKPPKNPFRHTKKQSRK